MPRDRSLWQEPSHGAEPDPIGSMAKVLRVPGESVKLRSPFPRSQGKEEPQLDCQKGSIVPTIK